MNVATLLRRGGVAPAPAFSPADVAGLNMWFAADALALSDTDPVTSWADASAVGNTVAQGTGGKQPIYRTNIVNGKPVVRFDGSDDILYNDAATLPTATMTIFAVQQDVWVTGAETASVGMRRAASGFPIVIVYSRGTSGGGGARYRFRDDGGTLVDSSAVAALQGSFHVIEFRWDGTTAGIRSDGGTEVTAAAAGVLTVDQLAIGGVRQSTNDDERFKGDIAEVVGYSTHLDATNRGLVRGYLGTKYGITVS